MWCFGLAFASSIREIENIETEDLGHDLNYDSGKLRNLNFYKSLALQAVV
jgi:hypothetical protein